jgi:hypothetical protein
MHDSLFLLFYYTVTFLFHIRFLWLVGLICIQYIARTHVTMVLKRALSTNNMFYKATTEPFAVALFFV